MVDRTRSSGTTWVSMRMVAFDVYFAGIRKVMNREIMMMLQRGMIKYHFLLLKTFLKLCMLSCMASPFLS
jgi:hypothetical protein